MVKMDDLQNKDEETSVNSEDSIALDIGSNGNISDCEGESVIDIKSPSINECKDSHNDKISKKNENSNQAPLFNVREASKIVEVGEKRQILSAHISALRKRGLGVKSNFSGKSNLGDFVALSAGAHMFLASKPVMRTNLSKIAEEAAKCVEESKACSKIKKQKLKHPNNQDDEKKSDKAEGNPISVVKQRKGKGSESDSHYCELCDSTSNSKQSYLTHLQGRKHLKKVAASKDVPHPLDPFFESLDTAELQRVKIEDSVPHYRVRKSGSVPKIQTKLDLTDSPCTGLNFVTEIWPKDETMEPLYVCHLCSSLCQPVTIISHITGYKHRLNYMKMADVSTYVKIKALILKKSELSKLMEEHAERLEGRDGRGQIVVEKEVEEWQAEVLQTNKQILPKPQLDSSVFKVGDVCYYPSSLRMNMLEELSNISTKEITSDAEANRLEYIISNFKQAVRQYELQSDWGAFLGT